MILKITFPTREMKRVLVKRNPYLPQHLFFIDFVLKPIPQKKEDGIAAHLVFFYFHPSKKLFIKILFRRPSPDD